MPVVIPSPLSFSGIVSLISLVTLSYNRYSTDGLQQAGARLPQAPAGYCGLLAVLLVLDSAPSAGLEQLWHRGGRNQLLCVLDGADGPVSRLHHLPLYLLPGSAHGGDDLLLQQAIMGRQTGRAMTKCVCVCECVCFAPV